MPIRSILKLTLINNFVSVFASCQIKDLVTSIEIWGFESLDIIERIHLKFLKYIFNLKSSTPTYMVYGETGRL